MSSKSAVCNRFPTGPPVLTCLPSRSDPFADTHNARPQALDDNPFADTSDPINPFSNPSNNASSFSLESQTTPVPGGRHGQGGFQAQQDDAGYRAREEELRRRDEEVQRRQRELDERERRLDAGEGKANWPFCEYDCGMFFNPPPDISRTSSRLDG